ncbi:MAG: hypothetical protein NCW75_05610 [Phycisphaera sp.]|nr:MAG: hypothetical protein NCW75_05610 [Phycisphaera sp.]
MSHNRIITVVGLAVIALALFASACVDEQGAKDMAQESRQVLEPVVSDLTIREADLTARIEDPAATPEQIEEAEAELDSVEQQLEVATRSLEAAIEIEADPAGGIVSQTLGFVMPFVPVPYRLPMVLGGSLLVSALRQYQLRKAGREIARGVEIAAQSDAALKKGLQDNAGTIRIHQGGTARRLVDEAQGKKPARIL